MDDFQTIEEMSWDGLETGTLGKELWDLASVLGIYALAGRLYYLEIPQGRAVCVWELHQEAIVLCRYHQLDSRIAILYRYVIRASHCRRLMNRLQIIRIFESL